MTAAALPWTPPSTSTLVAFQLIVFFVVACFVGGNLYASPAEARSRRSLILAAGTTTYLGIHLGISTQLEAFLPLSLGLYLVLILVFAIGLAFSPFGTTLAQLPLVALVAFPIFRFPLELILHEWAAAGVIPESMTWTGQNIDILAGVIGPLGAVGMLLLPTHRRSVAWVTNTLGTLLLLNVIRVAVLSAPLPIRSFGDPPLVLPLHPETTWIVSVCVAGALAGHLITYRALSQIKKRG